MQNSNTIILAIESSCDDTSCAVLRNDRVLSNIVSGQKVHARWGGVVPELASRDHQRNIIPVCNAALEAAGVNIHEISAVAVTRGPGLMGSLLVGLSFAKSLSQSLNIPLVGVNHMQAHILAHFIQEEGKRVPEFPFICLTVSGGHTQLVKVSSHLDFELLGETIDDAVGEAFDKAAKLLGLPYPGGPLIDKLANSGNGQRFTFAETRVGGYDYSFSGIKTSFLYFLQRETKNDPDFIAKNLEDICASYQAHLVHVLLKNVKRVLTDTGISRLALAGGVSANSHLRAQVEKLHAESGVEIFIPPFEYCTDNAAMVGIAGYYLLSDNQTADIDITPLARMAV